MIKQSARCMMIFTRTAASVLVITMMQQSIAYAQEPVAEDTIAIIKRVGAPTPFTGVLFSDYAYAKMKAQQDSMKERFENEKKLELSLLENRLKLSTATTANALDALRLKDAELFKEKDRQNEQLIERLKDADDRASMSNVERLLWLSGGIALAIGSALIVFFATNGHVDVVVK